MKWFFRFLLWLLLLFNNHTLYSQEITWYNILQYTGFSTLFKCAQTKDQGYISVGENRISNDYKIFFIKFNQYGDSLWSRHYDLNNKGNYRGFWIDETFDNGFIISGSGDGPNTDSYIIRIDSLGNIDWVKIFSTSALDQGRCVKELPDKGFILLTRSAPFPYNNIVLTRTDSAGNSIWSKTYTGHSDHGMEVDYVPSSGFVVAGWRRFESEDVSKLYLMRADLNGDTLWTKLYNEFYISGAYSIDVANDNGFIIGGVADTSQNNIMKAYIVKVDSVGNIQWQKRYANGFNETCYSIRKYKDKGYVFCGFSDSLQFTNQRGVIRVIDLFGNVLHENYLRVGGQDNRFYSVELTNDNGFILSGNSSTSSNVMSLMVKTDSTGQIYPVGINNSNFILEEFKLNQNYPNPFNPVTKISYSLPKNSHISLVVYDILGKEIITLANEKQNAGEYSVVFDGSNFASGLYFYKLQTDQFFETKKMLLLK